MKTIKLMLIAVLGMTMATACKKQNHAEQDQYNQLNQFKNAIVGKFGLTSYTSNQSKNISQKDWPFATMEINESANGDHYELRLADSNNSSISVPKAYLQTRSVEEQISENNYSCKFIISYSPVVNEEYILTLPRFDQLQLKIKREEDKRIYTYTYLLTKK